MHLLEAVRSCAIGCLEKLSGSQCLALGMSLDALLLSIGLQSILSTCN